MDNKPSDHLSQTTKSNTMIQALINRYKRMRTERFLHQTYQYQYAFVGMGQHSLTNLYPVLHYLGVPLKYICVTSERKARLIERKFHHVKATTSLDTILNDDEVKGVFVSASPSAHFSIASQVLQSGKSLFIENLLARLCRNSTHSLIYGGSTARPLPWSACRSTMLLPCNY